MELEPPPYARYWALAVSDLDPSVTNVVLSTAFLLVTYTLRLLPPHQLHIGSCWEAFCESLVPLFQLLVTALGTILKT